MRSISRPDFAVFVLATLFALEHSLVAESPRYLFGTPQLLQGISTPGIGEDSVGLTSDGLDLFFASNSGKGTYPDDLYLARRNSPDADFGPAVPLSLLNTDRLESQPNISSDGLTLYYISADDSNSPGEIWTATRSNPNDPFSNATRLFAPEPNWSLVRPSVSSDKLVLYMQATDLSRSYTDVYVSRRESTEQPWGDPEPVPELSDPELWQSRPFISMDDTTLLFYDSDIGGGLTTVRGGGDLAMLVRPTSDLTWSAPINLGNAINTSSHEDMPTLSPDGRTLYFSRYDSSAVDDPTWYNSADIWQAKVQSFDSVGVSGGGGSYSQGFDSLGTDSSSTDTAIPTGWTFTANDIVFNNATTDKFPASRRNYAGVYNGGAGGDADRALMTDHSLDEGGELDFRAHVQDADLRALRLEFDLEAWQVFPTVGNGKGEAAFQIVLEADSGEGFVQVADLGMVSTGQTLARPATGSLVNGNDPAYRLSYDSGPRDVDVPKDATLRVRWISTDVAQQKVVFGLDNVSLRFAAPGDANIDGVFNSTDLIEVLANGEYEDNIAGNSTWSEGDWDNDNEFNSTDLIEALATGLYEPAAGVAAVPEPATHVLVALGVLALTFKRRAVS